MTNKKIGVSMNAPAVVSMRETAYGPKMDSHIFNTVRNAEAMRNDDDMLAAAEAKRQRKADKRTSK
jgi:hypothetical protein